ncbi:MAG TPA: ATP-binding cassette domain-containing protein [Pseudonocardiaceae bacterium]|nr:ATP-binding cassette domain-containing protein [Pseudonocardiaceae bacterium]
MHDGSGRITVQGLTKQFGPVTAVQNLSFTVEPGSVTGFLGPNGAGKTTTLRMALGLVNPTAGTATINGVPFGRLGQPARVVGAVLEAQGFHPKRTARDHLRVYSAAIGMPDARADQVLQLVGLGPAAGRGAGGFSLGMKQRLALATALLGDPQILVLDEPANGLDPEGIAWLRSFLQAYARAGRTVLISSHILAEVEQTVDQVIIISRGQTMYNGPLEHLRRSQQSRVLVQPSDAAALTKALRDEEIYNVEALQDGRLAVGGVAAKQVADIALKAGVSVYGIEEERVNLEQLYFSLTNGAPFGGPYQPGYPPPQQVQSQYPPQQQYQQPYQPPYQQPPYDQQQYQQPYQQPQYPPQQQYPYPPQQPYQQPPNPYAPPQDYQPQDRNDQGGDR